jgi:hypothetical protein
MSRSRRLLSASWPTVGEEAAGLASLRGEQVDADWLGRTLRGEEIGGYFPRGHGNSLRVWEAVECYSWGWSLWDVGDEVNADCATVRYWFKKANIVTRPTGLHSPLATGKHPASARRHTEVGEIKI